MDFAFPIGNGCWAQGSMRHSLCCPTAAELPYTRLVCLLQYRHSQWEGGRRREVWLALLPGQTAGGCWGLQTGSLQRFLVWHCGPVTKGTWPTVLGTSFSNEGAGYFWLLMTYLLVSFSKIVADVCGQNVLPASARKVPTEASKSPASANLNQSICLYFSHFCEIYMYIYIKIAAHH